MQPTHSSTSTVKCTAFDSAQHPITARYDPYLSCFAVWWLSAVAGSATVAFLCVICCLVCLQDELVQAMNGQWPDVAKDEAAPNRYGQGASHWVKVDEQLSLKQVLLQEDHIVPGVPLFWVLAKDTDYEKRFLAEELRRY